MKLLTLQQIQKALTSVKALISEVLTNTVEALTELETKIPSKVSELENDSGYLTSSTANTTYSLKKQGATITLVGSDDSEDSETFTKADIGLGNVPNVATDDQTPTFTPAEERENITSGNTMSILLGKIAKYFSDLKDIAFTGNYADLINKPSIPAAAKNGKLTIQKNSTTVATFTADQGTDSIADISVPTKISDLTNDSGFYNATSPPPYPVTKVNNKTGVITLNAGDVGAVPTSSWVQNSATANGYVAAGGANNKNKVWKTDGDGVPGWRDDANTTYGAMTGASTSASGTSGLVPAPGSGQNNRYLRSDGQWAVPPDTNTTYTNMTAASSTAAGKAGLVPAPPQGAQTKFLRGDGQWVVPTDTNTDTKVTQNVVSDNANYPLLLTPKSQTANQTTTACFDSGVTLNPSTNTIAANVSGTSSKLATARKLKVNLTSTADTTFDGSADNTGIGVTGILPVTNGGTGQTTVFNFAKQIWSAVHRSITAGWEKAFRTQTGSAAKGGAYLATIRTENSGVSGAPQYGAGLAFGAGDTHSYVMANYSAAQFWVGGGNADTLLWQKKVILDGDTATAATKLSAARTLKVNLASTSDVTFDGSANQTGIGVTGVLGTAHGGTGNANGTVAKLTTARTLKVNLASTGNVTFDGSANQTGIGVSGTLPVANGGTGNTEGKAASVAGTYGGNGGSQPPSWIGRGKVKFAMMNKFSGMSALPTYADCLLMDTYNGSDVAWATALAITRQSPVRGFLLSGADTNTTAWTSQVEILTTSNYKSTVTPANIGAAATKHTHTKSEITDFPSIPTTLKNPYALKFTGLVSDTYDGSAAKTVNIPNSTIYSSTEPTSGLFNGLVWIG